MATNEAATKDLDTNALKESSEFEHNVYRARVLARITATMLLEGEDIDRGEEVAVLSGILLDELVRLETAASKLARVVERQARRSAVVEGSPTLGDA